LTDAFTLSRQAQWETEGFRRAIARYREDMQSKELHEISAGQRLLRDVVPPLAALITEAQRDAAASLVRPIKRSAGDWALHIQLLPADKIAVITVSSVMRGVIATGGESSYGGRVIMVGRGIAKSLQAQVDYDAWAKESPDVEAFLRRRYPKVDKRTWRKWSKQMELIRSEPWGSSVEAELGTHLIALLCRAAPTRFFLENRRVMEGQTHKFLVPSQETVDLLEDVTARAEVARPLLMPMVCRPVPWKYEGKSNG
jgi:DNA-directed RNA polymerase